MATVLKPSPEQRLAELEAIQRPLTPEESEELRRILHTLYMRHWRAELAEREMNLTAASEHGVEPPRNDKATADAVADRMIAARNPDWRPTKFDRWQDEARAASDMLRDAILRAQAREAVAA
jgi:hypothetical protein